MWATDPPRRGPQVSTRGIGLLSISNHAGAPQIPHLSGGRQPGEPGFGAGYRADRRVMGFGWEVGEEFGVVEERDDRDQRADPGQRAIVAAAAAAQSVPGVVHGQR